jgi:hypothetical protein
MTRNRATENLDRAQLDRLIDFYERYRAPGVAARIPISLSPKELAKLLGQPVGAKEFTYRKRVIVAEESP